MISNPEFGQVEFTLSLYIVRHHGQFFLLLNPPLSVFQLMSMHLGPRLSCSTIACLCAAFILEDPDGSPRYMDFINAEAVCFMCGHTWISHRPDSSLVAPTNIRFICGGTGHGRCGGFTSLTESWNMRLMCMCGIPWTAHDVAERMQINFESQPVSSPPAPMIASTSAAVAPQRPVLAFTGLPRPAASVAQQRRDSMQRNLPQHQHANADAAIVRATKKARLSGPPRSFSASSSSSAFNLADFASTSELSAGTRPVSITVCILPKVLDTSEHNDTLDLSPRYFWRGTDDLEVAQERLQLAKLVFTVTVPPSGPIFEQINTSFLSSVASPVPTPNTMAWVLLGANGRVGNRTWVETLKPLTKFTFTLAAIRGVPYSYTPNYIGQGPMPVIASLIDDPDPVCAPSCSRGSLPDHRIRPFPIALPDSDDDDYKLYSDMVVDGLDPLDEDTPPPSPFSLMCLNQNESRRSVSPVTTRSAHRRQWQEEASVNTAPVIAPILVGPLLLSAIDLAKMSVKVIAHLWWEVLWTSHFIRCREQELQLCPHGRFTCKSDLVLNLEASSVDLGARALIVYCIWVHVGRPHGLKLKEVLGEQFTAPRPTIEFDGDHTPAAVLSLQVQIGPGFGRGPKNEVISRAIEILLADGQFWTNAGEYKILALHPSHTAFPRRSCILKATGLIFLLHYIFIGAPIPVSPFLFSTMFDGREATCRYDVEFLSRFIPTSSLDIISQFHSSPLKDPLYTSQGPACVKFQYLLNIAGCDHHPDFLDLTDGFNIALTSSGTPAMVRHVLEETHHRLLRSPHQDSRGHSLAPETNPTEDPWEDNHECMKLLTQFITHYLTQPGHPSDPDGVVDALLDGNATAGSTDPLLRAKLFLSILTGSELLPLDNLWIIKGSVTHDWDDAYPASDPNGNDDYGPETRITFKSCFRTFTVLNNARLRKLLLSETPVDGIDTQFGRMFHTQLLATKNYYSEP
ncbi:hypothetical protein C8J57DRAFT_1227883 [Mycena rebaudengoi]|nr:hypothetical protein C8J57DRAFT_1227883 [Mycena rebaudengoi]